MPKQEQGSTATIYFFTSDEGSKKSGRSRAGNDDPYENVKKAEAFLKRADLDYVRTRSTDGERELELTVPVDDAAWLLENMYEIAGVYPSGIAIKGSGGRDPRVNAIRKLHPSVPMTYSRYIRSYKVDGRVIECYGVRYDDSPDFGVNDYYDLFEGDVLLNKDIPFFEVPTIDEVRVRLLVEDMHPDELR